METKQRALHVYRILDEIYPKEIEFLVYSSAFQLLISVILSAQTTDNQVNAVTPRLFSSYPTPKDLCAAEVSDIENIIHSIGFFRRKALLIREAACTLVKNYDGEVPLTMKELLTIPGVGRKSASVIIGHIAGEGAIITDTHFMRVVRRLGLTEKKDPLNIEREIASLIDVSLQFRFSMTVNLHGRRVCHARHPSCSECPLQELCLSSDGGHDSHGHRYSHHLPAHR
ncbi:MAG: endonuclease III [Sphaerochaetaceae bacterium]|nr:endonuclease III [Sphaerochaetaceae bacterium]